MCSLHATALQHLQDAWPLDILCISSKPTTLKHALCRFPTQRTAACQADANAAEESKLQGGCQADHGASMSSLTEVHWDKLSLLSQHGQPLWIPAQAQR